MKQSIFIFILIISIGLLAQPRAFDPDYFKDGAKNLNDKEREHYNKYKEKYIKLGLETETKNSNLKQYSNYMLNLFYHFGINLDKIEEYKKELDIDLIERSKDGLFGGLVYELLFSHAVVIATVAHGENVKNPSSSFNGQVTYKVDEVLKGEDCYEIFPEYIKCYYHSLYEEYSTNGTRLYTIYYEMLIPGDKCILFLRYRGKDYATQSGEDCEEPNVFYEPVGYKLNTSSELVNKNIKWTKEASIKLNRINKRENVNEKK